MGTISRKIALLFVVVCLSAGQAWAGSVEEYSKTVSKEFTVGSQTLVGINNKFGSIQVTTWNESKVSIEVLIKVDAKNPEKGQKVLDRINISFEESASELLAITEFGAKSSDDKVLEVNYIIKMPVNNPLSIKNKFGDVVLTELNGKLALDLSYGNISAGKLHHADTKIDMNFSEGTITSMTTGNIELSYAQLNVESADVLELDTEFSEFKIGTVKTMKLDSKYDEFEIGQIGVMDADCQFSTIEVKQLISDMNVDLQYGTLTVAAVNKGFKKISVESEFGDVTVKFESGAGYSLTADVSFGDLSYPNGSKVTETESSHTSKSYAGTVGSGGSAVDVDLRYGNMTLN